MILWRWIMRVLLAPTKHKSSNLLAYTCTTRHHSWRWWWREVWVQRCCWCDGHLMFTDQHVSQRAFIHSDILHSLQCEHRHRLLLSPTLDLSINSRAMITSCIVVLFKHTRTHASDLRASESHHSHTMKHPPYLHISVGVVTSSPCVQLIHPAGNPQTHPADLQIAFAHSCAYYVCADTIDFWLELVSVT